MDKALAQKSSSKTQGKQNSSSNRTRASRSKHLNTGANVNSLQTPHQLASLHQSLGNRAVGRMIQAKLTISQPDDQYEHEADQVADKVMRMPDPVTSGEEETKVQTKPLSSQITPLIHRMPESMADEKAEQDEETIVATKPLIQRVPLAVREDDEEEKVAAKLETDASIEEEREEKPIQAKLAIDMPLQRQAQEDEENKEAELVAARMIHRQLDDEKEEEIQAKQLPGSISQAPTMYPSPFPRSVNPMIQRLCSECEEEMQQEQGKPEMARRKQASDQLHDDHDEEEKHVQPKGVNTPAPQVSPSIAANIHALNHGGSPLPKATRTFFEPRFGVDLSGVRVHTGSRASETAKSINARAFTVGNNIAFGSGQFAPESQDGQRLLAHELTHTIQQGATNISRSVSTPHCPATDLFITAKDRPTSSVVQPKKIIGSDRSQ